MVKMVKMVFTVKMVKMFFKIKMVKTFFKVKMVKIFFKVKMVKDQIDVSFNAWDFSGVILLPISFFSLPSSKNLKIPSLKIISSYVFKWTVLF